MKTHDFVRTKNIFNPSINDKYLLQNINFQSLEK